MSTPPSETYPSPAADRSRRILTALFCVIVAALLVVAMNGPDLARYAVGFATGAAVPDDSFMYLPPYMTDAGVLRFADDPLAGFFREAHAPQGYDMLYRFLGEHSDIRQTGGVAISLALHGVLLFFVLRTGHLLAGWPGAICAGVIVLSSVALNSFMTGGFPRSFGPPLMAMTIYGLCSGRLGYVVAATILGVLLYYMAGVLSGLALLLYCLLPQAWRPGSADLSLARRAVLLAVTGAVSLAILGASLSRDHDFGAQLTPADYAEYPEAGPEGRFWAPWTNVAQDLAAVSMTTFDRTARQGGSWSDGLVGKYLTLDRAADGFKAVLGGALLGLFVLAAVVFRTRAIAGIALVIATASLLYLAAVALFPLLFFPARFFQVVMPIATALLFAWAGQRLLTALRPSMSGLGQTGVLLLAVALILIATGRPQWPAAQSYRDAERQLFAFVQTLPAEARLAGWPDNKVMDGMPFFGERPVLLNFETHLPLREDYARLTRDRMEVLIDALVAGDPTAFAQLQDRFGVTHVLVNDSLIDGRRFSYFAPFQAQIDMLEDHGAGYELLRAGAVGPVVFEAGDMAVVELKPGG